MKIVAGGRDPQKLPPEVVALLERRAERLRVRPPSESSEQSEYWVAEFPVGDDLYGISLLDVRGAQPLRQVTPIPLAPAHVIGIVRFQGQVLSVMSLASLLGVRGWRVDPTVLLIVDIGKGQLAAVDCEQIPRAVALPLHTVEEARTRRRGAIVEVVSAGPERRLLHLIDPLGPILDARRTETSHGS